MSLRLTPDGRRYALMGKGERQPLPFHLRWLVPAVCHDREAAWIVLNLASILAVVLGTGYLALWHGATLAQACVAALLMAGMPSLRFAWAAPVLVDMPALAVALGAALLWPLEPYAAVAVALLAGAISEKAPVWAAVFALSPWLLLGLVAPLLRWALIRAPKPSPHDPLAVTLEHPIQAALEYHRGRWRDPLLMLTPWGVCLVALLAPSPWLWLALAVGYAQLLLATDSVRLYQQAAPVACVSAALLIPDAWAIPAVVAHWFNPLGGNGL